MSKVFLSLKQCPICNCGELNYRLDRDKMTFYWEVNCKCNLPTVCNEDAEVAMINWNKQIKKRRKK